LALIRAFFISDDPILGISKSPKLSKLKSMNDKIQSLSNYLISLRFLLSSVFQRFLLFNFDDLGIMAIHSVSPPITAITRSPDHPIFH